VLITSARRLAAQFGGNIIIKRLSRSRWYQRPVAPSHVAPAPPGLTTPTVDLGKLITSTHVDVLSLPTPPSQSPHNKQTHPLSSSQRLKSQHAYPRKSLHIAASYPLAHGQFQITNDDGPPSDQSSPYVHSLGTCAFLHSTMTGLISDSLDPPIAWPHCLRHPSAHAALLDR
jgi:hypothetical protein